MSIKRELWITVAGVMAVMAATASIAATDLEQELIDRIKPVGEVCIQGKSDCAAPVAAVASGPRSGEQVYGAACVACHDSGLAGAPKIAVAADWAPRIAQGEETLVSNAHQWHSRHAAQRHVHELFRRGNQARGRIHGVQEPIAADAGSTGEPWSKNTRSMWRNSRESLHRSCFKPGNFTHD